ncbi:MAG: FKBP-type peptidyl-prolyl cis-trans isomerase, partial [Desulfuromonadales bacterium]|nr:FKBP-type peptidyl-prolyl cis-trans isomerase [Desulfuromonadales bacterium]
MHKLIVTILIALFVTPVFAAEPSKTEEQKTLYAVGMVVARQLSVFNLSPAEFEIVKQGLTDAVTGKTPEVQLSAYTDKIQELARE